MHSAWPLTSWKEPGGQLSQDSLPVTAAWEPGKHSVMYVEPAPHELPMGQAPQPEALSRPVAPLYVPGGHGVGVALPKGQ